MYVYLAAPAPRYPRRPIKGGREVARMDGANPVELEKLVTANATKRQ